MTVKQGGDMGRKRKKEQKPKKITVYMYLDENCDLPLYTCDTAEELAKVLGVRKKTIFETICKYRREGKPCRYLKVTYYEEDDEWTIS